MARTCMRPRENRRLHLATKTTVVEERTRLKKILNDANADFADKIAAAHALADRARDESRTRQKNRCGWCDRSRGFYRRFGICRCCLRKSAMFGLIPGLIKASW